MHTQVQRAQVRWRRAGGRGIGSCAAAPIPELQVSFVGADVAAEHGDNSVLRRGLGDAVQRCEHTWVPRETARRTKVCPKCKSLY